MSSPAPEITIQHDAAAHRFEALVDGHKAVAEYELSGNEMIFTHTFVPPGLRGRGIAEKLVRAGLDEARRRGRTIVPRCSYVAQFLERHPELKSPDSG